MLKNNTKKQEQVARIEQEIEELLETLKEVDVNSQEYTELLKRLGTLYEYRNSYKTFKVDQNTVATVVGSLAGILLITSYEKANVLTSKALSFVIRKRA